VTATPGFPISGAQVAEPAPTAVSGSDRAFWSSLTLDILVVSGVALVLGLVRLGTPSFWVDEAFTAYRTEQPYTELVEGYHWLYQTILNTWAFFAGTSEWALRFPSVVGAMLSSVLLVVLARRVFDRRVALISGLLLAVSPFFVKWSQQARGYTLLVAVSLIATLLLLRALERGSRGEWALYGLAFAAVVVWHPIAGLVLLPSHVVLMAQRRERLLPHALLAAVIVCALGGFWSGQLLERSTGEGPLGLDWLKAPSPEGAARTFLSVSGAAGVGALLAAIGLVILVRRSRTDLAVWLGVWACGPFALTLLLLPLKPLYLDRYLITAAPAFALLAAVALTGLGRRLGIVAGGAALVATVAGLVVWYSSGESGGNWRGENWRAAVRTVLERRTPGQPIVMVPWSVRQAATYYGADVTGVSTADSIWVLHWSEEEIDVQRAERRALGFGEHRRVEKLNFGRRLSVQLWRRPSL
jgi:mannosyltransferase